MATIRRIDKIEPIEGADKIVCATVGGWKLVTAIDNGFKEGDLVVYCEIDSWIPTSVAPFLTKPGHVPKVYEGVEGEKLRTIKLRGQISQGLIMPLSVLTMVESELIEGLDVSVPLGIVKYEPPVSAALAGVARGNFPSWIYKTDQERIQNLKREFPKLQEHTWEVTEKLEGSSLTAYIRDGVFGVCSRNLDLVETEGNTFWKVAREQKLEEKLRVFGKNIAVQGELIGEGVQDNIYKIKGHNFCLFDVFLIDTATYMLPHERLLFAVEAGINHAPRKLGTNSIAGMTMEEVIALADGDSEIGVKPKREGLVFKSTTDHQLSFKVISNVYLSKQKD